MVPDRIKSTGELPLTASVRFAPPSSREPAIVGVVAKLSLIAVIVLPESINMLPPAMVTVGLTIPLLLLNVMVFRTLLPSNVRAPPPLIVRLLVPENVPLVPLCTMAALLRMMSPLMRVAPAGVKVLPIVSCPWFTTVAPV